MRAFAEIIPPRYLAAGILIAAGMFWLGWWQGARRTPTYITAPVERATVRRTVAASGEVVATVNLPLSFPVAGTLRRVSVREGDHVVREGQVLAELENTELRATLLDAQAKLKAAQAKLVAVHRGPTPEDVAFGEASLKRAREDLASAKANLEAIRTARAGATGKARRAYLGDASPATPSPGNTSTAVPVVSGTYTGTAEGSYRVKVVSSSFYDVSGLETATAVPISRIGPTPVGTAGVAIQFSATGTITMGDEWTIQVPDATRPDHTDRLRAYQAAVADEETGVGSAEASVDLKSATVREAEAHLAQLKAPVKPEDSTAAESAVLAAQAEVARRDLAFAKTFIRAPVAGVIMSVEKLPGQFLPASTPVLTILDVRERQVRIEVDGLGADEPRAGDQVVVRFPKLDPDRAFTHKILAVNAAGADRYTINTSVPDRRDIAVGDPAEVSLTLEKADAIAVPTEAIAVRGNQRTVRVVGARDSAERIVTIGLAGDELTEVLSGLRLGEQVAVAERHTPR